jgi:GrpB-like predicted nucleotidyltransferase (UPF0157 family)
MLDGSELSSALQTVLCDGEPSNTKLDRNTMIGLNRHIVQVVEHHPNWAALAADACQEVQRVCGNLLTDLQHVGSTSVPDLPAKPILDIAAAVVTLDAIPALVQRLTGIGYLYRGDGGEEGGHLFVRESSPEVRTLHLHVVEHHGTQWRNYLCFRDLLRQHPEIREQYAGLKQELGNRFQDDRKSYTASKHDFIRGILETQAAQRRASDGDAAPFHRRA